MYTHRWDRCDPFFKNISMASCDSEQDRIRAKADGWRTFRVRGGSEPMMPGEFVCPASAEGGKVADCATCRLCSGGASKAKDPVIFAHGAGAKAFEARIVTIGEPRK
jgi:hypothetical protein